MLKYRSECKNYIVYSPSIVQALCSSPFNSSSNFCATISLVTVKRFWLVIVVFCTVNSEIEWRHCIILSNCFGL